MQRLTTNRTTMIDQNDYNENTPIFKGKTISLPIGGDLQHQIIWKMHGNSNEIHHFIPLKRGTDL
jgi:hypothetical protein